MKKLEKPVRNTVKKAFELTKGEEVLIVTDEKNLEISKVFAKEIKKIGAQINLYLLPENIRPIRNTTHYLKRSIEKIDLLIYILENRAEEKGFRVQLVDIGRRHSRVCMMPGITEGIIRRTLNVDYNELRELTKKITDSIRGKEKIKVTNEKGTDITFSVKGREFQQDTGKITMRGSYGNLPSGETFTAPVEENFTGKIYFDYLSSFETEGGHLEFKNGEVIDYSGIPEELEEIMKEKKENRTIGEFGIGTNPKAHPNKSFLESEKTKNTVHFSIGDSYGIGKNKSEYHFGFLVEKPTLKTEEKTIMEKGKFKLS
ncbi:MAG: aminopeptidase [archaeon]